jgi:hypothetical protein
MPRKTKTEQEANFMRSFWEEAITLQQEYAAAVGLHAYPTKRPGVWRFSLVFTPLIEDRENPLGDHAIRIEYPNGGNQSLAGALWDLSMKLTNQVDEMGLTSATRKKSGG